MEAAERHRVGLGRRLGSGDIADQRPDSVKWRCLLRREPYPRLVRLARVVERPAAITIATTEMISATMLI